ncbi:CRISPR-associated endonuclease Cas9 [Frankliniella fusca]|uniref:CRISPR-associated endonuclease Cas9 n=1 Tax=Frankliniella fusca TaxID=407009 RepID=A0AAE1HZX2_9NEOP|nr:CRISPR-associated endonuclease Cas9 [Frankliniella fusca]
MSGVWCDKTEPPMNTLLKPIVETVVAIQQEGGVLWKHPQTASEHRTRVRVSGIVADAPARAKVQNILSHSGNQGCNTCEQSMQRLPLTPEEIIARRNGVKVRCKRAYIYQEIPARLRTHARMKRQANQAYHTNQNVEGVKGPTWVSRFPKLDVARCVFAEYMHGTCLGVSRHFLKVWLTCISGKLPGRHVQHWSLLVASIFLLLKEEISNEDLDRAKTMLNEFVRNVSVLYRDWDYVYNVHQLCHLPLYVKRFGPLWSTSAFFFEGCNGNLAGLIHGTKNRGKELMKNIRIAHGVQILRSHVENRLLNCGSNIPRTFQLLSKVKNASLEADVELLRSKGFNVHIIKDIFARAKKGRYILTSKLYTREKKRGNFTIKYLSCGASGYADIKYCICYDGANFAVVDRLRINHIALFFIDSVGFSLTHIVPVERDPMETIVLTLDEIVTKVMRVGDFVCLSPNRYETNL